MELIPSTSHILREVARVVTDIPVQVLPHIVAMRVLMKEKDGAGLGAPQVGISLRFSVSQIHGHSLVINPTIIKTFGHLMKRSEGCLSFPGRTARVGRQEGIHTEWMDEKGEVHHTTLRGMDARIFQHETDHLNGICIFP